MRQNIKLPFWQHDELAYHHWSVVYRAILFDQSNFVLVEHWTESIQQQLKSETGCDFIFHVHVFQKYIEVWFVLGKT